MNIVKSCVIMTALSLLAAPVLADGGTIQVRLPTDIRSTNNGVIRSGNTDVVLLHVVEGLVGYRNDMSVGPVLADSVNVSDDGLAYTFDLRDGVTFHNGEPMTSADVLWTWNRYMDEATNWRCRSQFTGENGTIEVVSVEAPDSDTVVFTIAAPSPLFLVEMARIDCGSAGILHRDSVAEDGTWIEPIGTGPFRLVEWVPGQRTVLERFDDYMPGEGPTDGYTGTRGALVDRIVWNVIPDAASAKAAMRAGEIHLTMGLVPTDLEEMVDAGFVVESATTPLWYTFLISRHDAFMQNRPLRQAMAHALDMDALVEALGFERHNASPIPPISTFYSDTQAETYGHDIERVQALLEEAGYTGETITMVTTRNQPLYYEQAVIAQSMWRDAGIDVELEVMDWGATLDTYRSGEYQIMSFGFSPRFDPALSWEMFSGEQTRKVWNAPEAIGLIEQLMVETDAARRQALADDLQRLFLDQVPAIGLYSRPIQHVVSPALDGFEAWPGGRARLWGVSLSE